MLGTNSGSRIVGPAPKAKAAPAKLVRGVSTDTGLTRNLEEVARHPPLMLAEVAAGGVNPLERYPARCQDAL